MGNVTNMNCGSPMVSLQGFWTTYGAHHWGNLAQTLTSLGSGAWCSWPRSDGRTTAPGWEMPTHVGFIQGASSFTRCHCVKENSGSFKMYFQINKEVGEDISPLIQRSLIHISTHSFNGEHVLCKYSWEWLYMFMYMLHLLPLSIMINVAKRCGKGGHDKEGSHKF